MLNILSKYNVLPQKRFGQNFLIDENIADKIIETSSVSSHDIVIEIGPGLGAMTKKICKLAKKVIAVEIDKKLSNALSEELRDYDNFTLITGDFLKITPDKLLEGIDLGIQSVKVIANLPYYITTPILMHILENASYYNSVTVMLQREVAERLTAAPGSKAYGAITLALNYCALPEIAFHVSPNCFYPKPGVDSVVMRLTVYDTPPCPVNDPEKMFKLIRAAFDQRRKTLCNAVGNFTGLSITKQDMEKALEQMGINTSIRGERLSLAEFAALSDICFANI